MSRKTEHSLLVTNVLFCDYWPLILKKFLLYSWLCKLITSRFKNRTKTGKCTCYRDQVFKVSNRLTSNKTNEIREASFLVVLESKIREFCIYNRGYGIANL